MKNATLLLLFFLLSLKLLYATHNQGGYITAERVSGNQLEISVVMFKDRSSAADWDSVNLFISRNGVDIDTLGILLTKEKKYYENYVKATYIRSYNFPGPGKYKLSITDPNLIEGIQNVSGSVNVPLYFYTEVYLGQNFTRTVEYDSLTTRPVKFKEDTLFYHLHPESEGQKVSFKQVTPLQSDGTDVPGYRSVNASVNTNSGLFILPPSLNTVEGIYLFGVEATTYRNGQITSIVHRNFITWVLDNVNTESELTTLNGFPSESSANDYRVFIAPGTSDTFEVKWSDVANNKQDLFAYSPEVEVKENIISQSNTDQHSNFIINVDPGELRANPYYVTIRGESSFKMAGDTNTYYQTEDLAILVYTDQSMGIPQAEELERLDIHPNPVGNLLRITGTQVDEMKYYQIYDMSGRLVQSGNVRSGNIKVNALESGMYILKGADSKMQWSQGRFVKE